MLEFEVDLDKKKQCSDFYIFLGGVKESITQFVNIIGKPVVPPKWSFGPWMSSNNETFLKVNALNEFVEKSFIIDEDRLIIKLICSKKMKRIDIEKL